MQDIIFNINLNKSPSGRCMIETYTGTIKHINKKTYSGPLKSRSVDEIKNSDNISEYVLKQISSIFIGSESNQISKSKYLLTQNGLINFFSCLNGYEGLYCTILDGSLHEVEGISEKWMLSASRSLKKAGEAEIWLLKNDEFVKLTDKMFAHMLSTKSVVYYNNKLYITEQKLNEQYIMSIVKKKLKISGSFEPNLFFERDSGELYYQNKKENKLINIKPIPILYVYIDNDEIIASLNFSYNSTEIKANSKIEYISTSEASYYRDISEENRYIDLLIQNGWRRSKNEIFIFENINVFDLMFNNIANDFTLLTPEKKKIIASSNVSFSLGYSIRWFDINANVNINGRNYNIMPMINLSGGRQRFVEIDGELVLLPNIISEKKDIFRRNNDLVTIEKKDICNVLELSEQLNIKNISGIEELIDFDNICLHIPGKLQEILREYQTEGVKWLKYLYKNSFGGCLADDMGLGKTIQVIAFLSDEELAEKNLFHTIVIVPKTLIGNWVREFGKFNCKLKVMVYHGINRDSTLDMYLNESGVLITTYNTILNDIDKLSDVRFDCLFLDEAQYIKNSSSKTYNAIKRINSDIKIALTGTPFENNIGELWALMNLLNPGCLGSRAKFMKKYGDCYIDKDLSKRINFMIKPFILRRLKKDVLKELPDKLEQSVICSMSEEQRQLYDVMLYNVKKEIERLPDRFEIKSNSIILEGLLYLRQICCHPTLLRRELNKNNCRESAKFELFKLKITELQLLNKKVIVFSQFTKMLKIMERWAEKNNWKTFYLDGKTKNRQQLVDSFEESKEGIFFISLKAGGVGLNIVSCQYAVIYDPWWNPAVENQAADRIYRIGQKNDVFILKFITEDSIEEKIENLKSIKSSVSQALFEDTSTVKKLTISELKELLE